jgi:hypothetical protein
MPKLIGAGENTHSQDQSITEVSFRVTNNVVNRSTNNLFFISIRINKTNIKQKNELTKPDPFSEMTIRWVIQ